MQSGLTRAGDVFFPDESVRRALSLLSTWGLWVVFARGAGADSLLLLLLLLVLASGWGEVSAPDKSGSQAKVMLVSEVLFFGWKPMKFFIKQHSI